MVISATALQIFRFNYSIRACVHFVTLSCNARPLHCTVSFAWTGIQYEKRNMFHGWRSAHLNCIFSKWENAMEPINLFISHCEKFNKFITLSGSVRVLSAFSALCAGVVLVSSIGNLFYAATRIESDFVELVWSHMATESRICINFNLTNALSSIIKIETRASAE